MLNHLARSSTPTLEMPTKRYRCSVLPELSCSTTAYGITNCKRSTHVPDRAAGHKRSTRRMISDTKFRSHQLNLCPGSILAEADRSERSVPGVSRPGDMPSTHTISSATSYKQSRAHPHKRTAPWCTTSQRAGREDRVGAGNGIWAKRRVV